MKCFRLLIAAGASPFVLKQKDQKIKTAEKASLRSGPYPANQGKPGLESLRLCFAALWPSLWQKFLCPAYAPGLLRFPGFRLKLSCCREIVGITNCHCEEERRGNLVAVQSGRTSGRLW